jgi:SAM-dependent methyltransferase
VTTDQANVEFWNELCGSGLARTIGITDHSKDSLEHFDRAYLEFYPYLLSRVRLDELRDHQVLEIGLGYGTLGQKIVEAGARYIGVDIADTPVRMMRHRLRLYGLTGSCLRGSALSLPFPSGCMDYVISIGLLHHTGDVQRGLDEAYRVLKSGGTAVLMLYNQFSYRQWTRWPISTARALFGEMGLRSRPLPVTEAQRLMYDRATGGRAAPETVFTSVRRLRQLLGRFSRVTFRKENSDNFLRLPRKVWLPWLGPCLGLDIYIRAEK